MGKTAADGSYALRLDAVADAYVIQARTAHSDDNGAFLEVRLPEPRPDVAGGTVPIPVLRFWEPGIRPLLEGLKMRVDFDALAPDGYGELEFITLNVSPREQNAKTRPLYYESVVRPGVDFDVRAIEDVPSEISLNADTEASVEGIEIDLSVVSASVPIDAPARAPPSRKASCVMTPPHRACSLTDGDFEDEYYDGNRRQPVAIDLGRVFAARLVVFHGCFIDCTIETSPDGKSWRSKTFDTPHDQVIFWEEPGRVRFVRVAGEDTRHGRELSVWE